MSNSNVSVGKIIAQPVCPARLRANAFPLLEPAYRELRESSLSRRALQGNICQRPGAGVAGRICPAGTRAFSPRSRSSPIARQWIGLVEAWYRALLLDQCAGVSSSVGRDRTP